MELPHKEERCITKPLREQIVDFLEQLAYPVDEETIDRILSIVSEDISYDALLGLVRKEGL